MYFGLLTKREASGINQVPLGVRIGAAVRANHHDLNDYQGIRAPNVGLLPMDVSLIELPML